MDFDVPQDKAGEDDLLNTIAELRDQQQAFVNSIASRYNELVAERERSTLQWLKADNQLLARITQLKAVLEAAQAERQQAETAARERDFAYGGAIGELRKLIE